MRTKLLYFLSMILFIEVANAAVVSRIDVNGNERMDDESVRILANVKNGDNVSSETINNIAKELQSSGYFEKVDVKLNGNTLKINVVEAPIINMVTVEGNDEIDTEDLKKEIKTKERASYDKSVIGADVQRLLTLYMRKGFFGTKINPKKIELDNNRVNVVYEIKEGHPTYISDIDFENNKKFRSRTLRKELLSREHAWWRFMTQFDVYDEDRIQYDQQLLHQFYMRNGFLDFRITDVKGEFTENREYYSVKYTLDEGKQYKIGNITIDNPFPDVPDKELYKALTISKKDVYNIDEIDATVSALRGVVADHGYAFITVDPIPDKHDDTLTVDINFKIKKTNRIYINSINLLNNVRTFDSVIEHHLPMREGDPFSLQTIETGRQNLMHTRYFKDVQMVPTRLADANMMNLDVKVEEQPTGELSGGLGWSSINGWLIDAGITENNFMGRGQIVQIKGSIAEYQRQALFSFTEPFLFNRELSGGFDVSYTQYKYSSLGGYGYDRDSFMIAGRLGWRLTDHWTQTMRLSASFDQNYDLNLGGWQKANLYTLGTNLRYYNLHTNFQQNTHTGVVGNIGAAYTGFGGTNTFMRYNADITGMVKFFDDRWQLRSSWDFGYLQSLESDNYIPRVYRYFLGGESLRGFDVAGIGSRNWFFRNYSLGGLWKANGSTQLNFPIFIPDEYQVKGFVFADYGILGKPPKREFEYINPYTGITKDNIIDQDWRTSAGFGIYWNTPMGPMNFSWAWPMKINPYDDERRFLLSFETQF